MRPRIRESALDVDDSHPLARELVARLRTDPAILGFFDRGGLDGIWYRDLENPQAQWLSPRFKELFGYMPDETVQSSEAWNAIIHPEDLPRVMRNVDALTADPDRLFDQVVRYRHRAGHTIWVRCRGMMIRDEQGTPVRMLVMHTDLTALKRVEAQLAEANETIATVRQSADKAARGKADVLSRLSHEVRGPLSGIVGMLELLSTDPLTERQSSYLAVARQSSETLQAIIDGLLDLSRPASGTLTLDERSFDAALMFGHALAIFESRASAQGLELVTRIRPAAMRVLHGDPDRLAQVLHHLVSNAINFTPQGTVEVTVDCLDDPRQDDRLTLSISVRDTGIGIGVEARERILKRADREEGRARGVSRGSGLGLAIVMGLMDLMGGRIEVESVPGEGSLFRVRVPVRLAEQVRDAAGVTEHAQTQALAGLSMLVAEDNAGNQQMLRGMLDLLGCRYEIVGNGRDVVAAAVERRFDGVLMDLQMPMVDGLEATRRLRADPRVADDLPIIAISADATSADVERAWRAGVDDHLAKPVSIASLRAMIERNCLGEGRKPRAQSARRF